MSGRPDDVRVRTRTPADVPALVGVLAEQQAGSRYPLRWPLPFPAEDFVARASDDAAWVLEVAGAAAGHVAVGAPDAADESAFREHLAAHVGPGADDAALALVSTLFVGTAARGTGGGGALLDVAVRWAREQDRLPVLDVVPTHGSALAVYRHRGWTEIGRTRPAWLPDTAADVVLMVLSDAARPPTAEGRIR